MGLRDTVAQLPGHAQRAHSPDVNAGTGGADPERAVERNRILEFSSKISLNTLKYYIYVRSVQFSKG